MALRTEASREARQRESAVTEVRVLYRGTLLDVQHVGHPPVGQRGIAWSSVAARLGLGGSWRYTIGEGHDATFTVVPDGLPSPGAFPLVSGATLNFTTGMEGAITLDGEVHSLADLVEAGLVRTVGSTHAFRLPRGARCELVHQGLTFHVNSVPPGHLGTMRSQSDRRFWRYAAGAFALLASVIVPAMFTRPDEDSLGLDAWSSENRFVGYANQPDILEEPAPTPLPQSRFGSGTGSSHRGGGTGGSGRGSGGGGTGQNEGLGSHARDCSAWGLPEVPTPRVPDLLAVEDSEACCGPGAHSEVEPLVRRRGEPCGIPQMARNFDPDLLARNAGIVGMIHRESGHFLAWPYGRAVAAESDDEDVWGGLTGTEVGEAFGTAAVDVRGADGDGPAYGLGSGSSTRAPHVRQGRPTVKGSLDKDIIRRIVRAHLNEVRNCYASGLARDPKLEGRVSIQFTIGPTGKVPTAMVAASSVRDASVSSCLAGAVERWTFPRPQGGGTVVVTYPFVLEAR